MLPPNAETLRAAFEVERPPTVGIEEELMLLDPETHDLLPRGTEVLDRVAGDPRFKQEMPAAQVEIAAPPAASVPEAAALLRAARRELAAAAEGIGVLAGAGVHPFAHGDGALNAGARYEAIAEEFGAVARRQLVFGLHVHVAIAGADRALAAYNALREHLPALAALGAASPFYEGADMGLASVRPKICDLLPRQGVPPAIGSWEEHADAFGWGLASGRFADPAQWWFEARLHPLHGTVEVRVPDAQSTVEDTVAIAAVVHALVVSLAERHDAGELPPPAPGWRIGENRWSACRHGVEGTWCDVRTGATRPMREHLEAWVDELQPVARRLGCAAELAHARDLIARPRARMAREVAGEAGVEGLARWLAARFLG
ncbi:MAG: YbdK family carboxylate-amine ligase [Solirubrobacterales bacterium]|nr:YbdK family carboxylate-amine ligase [Solirubrobacterales bacterium]